MIPVPAILDERNFRLDGRRAVGTGRWVMLTREPAREGASAVDGDSPTAAALTAVVGLNAATNWAGSCPLSWATSNSVSGVICAVALLLPAPDPGTTECRTVFLSPLVAVSTQGKVLPLTVTE